MLDDILQSAVESGGHPASVIATEYPVGKTEVSGFKVRAIRIKDTADRSQRIQLRQIIYDKFFNAGFLVKENKLASESISTLEVYDKNVADSKIRIYFKKDGKSVSVTEFGESIVCYALSARQKKGTAIEIKDLIHYDEDNVHTFNRGNKVTLEACLAKLDEQWQQTAVAVANAFYQNEVPIGSKGAATKMTSYNDLHFHRGDSFVDDIGDCFKHAIKNTKEGRLASMNINKWNPSDIWISRRTDTLEFDKPSKYDTITSLNEYLDDMYDKGRLKGISLKKIDGTTTRLSKIKTATKAQSPITFEGFDNVGVDKFDTIDVFILFTYANAKGRMQFRSFGGGKTATDHQGSISKLEGQSEAAVHGKVGVYDAFLVDYIPQGFDYVEKKKIQHINNNRGQYEYYAIKYLKQLNPGKSIDDLLFEDYPDDKSFGSKFLGLQLCAIVDKLPERKRQEFLNDILHYAMSQIPNVSSVYLKNK